jgi:hypothetical protein
MADLSDRGRGAVLSVTATRTPLPFPTRPKFAAQRRRDAQLAIDVVSPP